MIHIVIDGYNLIRQVPALTRHEQRSLEAGRKKLILLLSQYKRIKHHKITVVFDGVQGLSEFAPACNEAGISVRYSPQGISADDVIKRIIAIEKERLVVVSSDHAIIKHAEAHKSSVISSPDFYDRLLMAGLLEGVEKTVSDVKKTTQHKRWLTYKKGPSKRAPKKQRRHQQRLKNL